MATSYQDPFGAADYSAEGTRGLLEFLRNEYPRIYGAGAGLLGNTPYDTANAYSVFDPKRQAAFEAAQVAFPAGVALDVVPGVRALKAPAMQLGRAGEKLAERVVPQVMERGGMGAGLLGDLAQGSVRPLDVYHGTPNRLPPTETNLLGEFDANKIGTGAGAQARGYGIYSSESPEFADYFALRKTSPDVEGIAFQNGLQLSRDAQVELMRQATKDSMGKPSKGDNYIDPIAAARKLQNASIEARKMPAEQLQNTIREFQEQNRAYLYKADLPDEMIPKMLDLDLPLSQQNSDVKKAINNLPEFVDYSEKIMGKPINTLSGDTLQKMMLGYQAELNKSAEGASALASEAFRKVGIPGNVYKELGFRNFVVYPNEEKRIKILERKTR